MTETNHDNPRGRSGLKIRFIIFCSVFILAGFGTLFMYGKTMLGSRTGASAAPKSITERGPILDRNGRILAMQTKMGNVTIWRPEMNDEAAIARRLSEILTMKSAEITERIRSSESDFLYIKKRVDQTALNTIEAARTAGELKGVGIEPAVGRVYPEKRLASQLIGFVGDDNIGLAGIEYAYQNSLAPSSTEQENGYGDQVFLTIDANAQHILEKIARKSMEENKATSAMFIALDPRTGEILAYVSLPDYDPNDIRASSERELSDTIAVTAYEPGSVFKIFSIASVMELGGITGNTTFTCDGAYEKVTPSGEKVTIKCLGAHGTVNAEQIIKYSCNAGAAYASDRVESEAFAKILESFGFASKTGSGLPGETPGFKRPVERWSLRSKQTIAIGQEIAVSALQMVQAASAIANDGILVKPRFVSRIVGPDGSVKQVFEPESIRRVLSAENARAMRSYMLSASSESGTGHRASVEDMRLAVKTGTAQLIDPASNSYSKTDYIASCLAMFPADEPRLVLYHVIVKPKGDSYLGGRIAAPPIREAAEELADYLGILRGKNQVAAHTGTVSIRSDSDVVISDRMPDLRGVSKRKLLPLLSREDLSVEIIGNGWVKRQTPIPGTPIEKGMAIRLELE
ncbi:MAG: penicillin-binding protein [Treponemataceae bacterium]